MREETLPGKRNSLAQLLQSDESQKTHCGFEHVGQDHNFDEFTDYSK